MAQISTLLRSAALVLPLGILFGCGISSNVQSTKLGNDVNAKRIYVIEDMNLIKQNSHDSDTILETFDKTFSDLAAKCPIEFVVFKAPPILAPSPSANSGLAIMIAEMIKNYNPDSLLEINAVKDVTRHWTLNGAPVGGNGAVMDINFDLSLTRFPTKEKVWQAKLDLDRRDDFWGFYSSSRMGDNLANSIFEKMSADGVISCPGFKK